MSSTTWALASLLASQKGRAGSLRDGNPAMARMTTRTCFVFLSRTEMWCARRTSQRAHSGTAALCGARTHLSTRRSGIAQVEGRGVQAPALLHALIHRSAHKKNSAKFTVANGSSRQRQTLDNRPCCTPLGSKCRELVAVVAPLCIKGLHLVTVQLPEKFLRHRTGAVGFQGLGSLITV